LASVGFLAKSASAQIRCKCTKKNGANDVSHPFFQTALYIPTLLISSPSAPPQNLPTNPQNSTAFHPNPTAFSSFSSIFSDFIAFFLSPQGEGKNPLARALCAHNDFSIFAFTSSPKSLNTLSHNTLMVKIHPQNPSPAAHRDFTLDAGAFSVPKNVPTRPQPADEKVNIKQG
jgi:hypothetical protein